MRIIFMYAFYAIASHVCENCMHQANGRHFFPYAETASLKTILFLIQNASRLIFKFLFSYLVIIKFMESSTIQQF